MTYEFAEWTLSSVGINQGYAFAEDITEKYFKPEQIGDLKAMTPGALDVKLLSKIVEDSILGHILYLAFGSVFHQGIWIQNG